MPFRDPEGNRTTIKFATFAQMPSLIFKACSASGMSNTRYVQEAVCEKLARDGVEPLPSLLAKLPPGRTNSTVVFGLDRKAVK